MTPGEGELSTFAIRRGDIKSRFDVKYALFCHHIFDTSSKTVSLGSLCLEEPCYGTSSSAIERTSEDQPKYIRITDFDDYGIESNHEYMTVESYAEKHLLKSGDILFARTGGTVGKTYYYDGSIGRAIFAGYCIRFRFDAGKVVPKFIYWMTKTKGYTAWASGIQRPSGQPNINKEEYKSFEIFLPGMARQQELVGILDRAEEERKEKLRQANELLAGNSMCLLSKLGLKFDSSTETKIVYVLPLGALNGRIDADYYSPQFTHFRKQIEELPFDTVSIGDISEKITTGFAAGKQDQADNLPDEQRVPQLRPFSITPEGELSFNTMKYIPKSRLKSDDYCKKNEVLFNNTNSPDLVGKTTVFDSDVLCTVSNHMTRITLKAGINPYYVAAFFNVLLSIGYWKLLCTNFNNQAGVNTETLKSVRIPLPEKEIQDQIVSEIMWRRSTANRLRNEAESEWQAAKEQFEKELLG